MWPDRGGPTTASERGGQDSGAHWNPLKSSPTGEDKQAAGCLAWKSNFL